MYIHVSVLLKFLSFSLQSNYYLEGNTGFPVFETNFGKEFIYWWKELLVAASVQYIYQYLKPTVAASEILQELFQESLCMHYESRVRTLYLI